MLAYAGTPAGRAVMFVIFRSHSRKTMGGLIDENDKNTSARRYAKSLCIFEISRSVRHGAGVRQTAKTMIACCAIAVVMQKAATPFGDAAS